MDTLFCIVCGTEFLPAHKNRICCSEECSKKRKMSLEKQKYHTKKGSIRKTCDMCGDTFYTSYSRQKCCSQECTRENRLVLMKKHYREKVEAEVKERQRGEIKDIDPKWLTRGRISYGGGNTITNS